MRKLITLFLIAFSLSVSAQTYKTVTMALDTGSNVAKLRSGTQVYSLPDTFANYTPLQDGLLSGGEATIGTGSVTIDTAVYRLNGTNYTSLPRTFTGIANSPSGTQYYLVVYGEIGGTLDTISGARDTIATIPSVPINTVSINTVLVGDGGVETALPNTSNFVTVGTSQDITGIKDYKTQVKFQDELFINENSIRSWTIKAIDSTLRIKSGDLLGTIDFGNRLSYFGSPFVLDTLNHYRSASNSYTLATGQPRLISGTNIKTVNSASLLGSGDLTTELPLTFGNGLIRSVNTITADTTILRTKNNSDFTTDIKITRDVPMFRLVGTQVSGRDYSLVSGIVGVSNTGFSIRDNTSSLNLLTIDASNNSVFPNGSLTANSFIKSGGLSTQFLKADGSVDATTYAPATGGTGYIQNGTGLQASSNFYISGTGRATGFGANIAPSSSTALNLSAGTTTISSFRMPNGVAPTSPVSGDWWSLTTGRRTQTFDGTETKDVLFDKSNSLFADGVVGSIISDGTGNLSKVPIADRLTSNVIAKTANYTVTLSDVGANGEVLIRVDATAGNVTITLPVASTATGLNFIVKKTDASVNTVTVSVASTIDGTSTKVFNTQYSGSRITSNGTTYSITGSF